MDAKPLKEQTRAEMLIALALKNYNQDLIANAEHFLHLVQAMYPCEIAEELLKTIHKSKMIIAVQEDNSTKIVRGNPPTEKAYEKSQHLFEKQQEMESEEVTMGPHDSGLLFQSKQPHKDTETMPENEAISAQNKAKEILSELGVVLERDEEMETLEGAKEMHNPELLSQSQQAHKDMETMPENEAISAQNKAKEIQSELEVVLERDEEIVSLEGTKEPLNRELLFQSQQAYKDTETMPENEAISDQHKAKKILSELEIVLEKDEEKETVEGTKKMHNPELLSQSQQAHKDTETMLENEAISAQNKAKEIQSELEVVLERDEEMETLEGTKEPLNPELLFQSQQAYKDTEKTPENEAITDQNKVKEIQSELEVALERDEEMETLAGTKETRSPELLFQSQQAYKDTEKTPENEAITDQNKAKEIQSELEVVLERDEEMETLEGTKETRSPELLFQSQQAHKDTETMPENEPISDQNKAKEIQSELEVVVDKSLSEPSQSPTKHIIANFTESVKCLETTNHTSNEETFDNYEYWMTRVNEKVKKQLDIARNSVNHQSPPKSTENIRATNIEVEKPVNSDVSNNEPRSEYLKQHLQSTIYNYGNKEAEMHLEAPQSSVKAKKLKKAEKMLPECGKVYKRKQATDLQEQIIGIKKLKCACSKYQTENIIKGSIKAYNKIITGGLADTREKLSVKETQRKEQNDNNDEVGFREILAQLVNALEKRDYCIAQYKIRQAEHLQPNQIINLIKNQVQKEEKMKNESAHLPTDVRHIMTLEHAINYLELASKAYRTGDFANATSFCKLAESWHESNNSRRFYLTCLKKKLLYKKSEFPGDKIYIINAEEYYINGDFSTSEKYLLYSDSSNLYVTELLKLVRAKKCLNQH